MGPNKMAMLLMVIIGGVLMQINCVDAGSDPLVCLQGFKNSRYTCDDRKQFEDCLLKVDINPEGGLVVGLDLSFLGDILNNLLGGILNGLLGGGKSKCNDDLEDTIFITLLNLLDRLAVLVIKGVPGGTGNGTDAMEFCKDRRGDVRVTLKLTCPVVVDYLQCIVLQLGVDIEALTGPRMLQLERELQKELDKLHLVCLPKDIIGKIPPKKPVTATSTTKEPTTTRTTTTEPTTTRSTTTEPTTTRTTTTEPTTTRTTTTEPTTTRTTTTEPTTTRSTTTEPTTTRTTTTEPTTTRSTTTEPTTTRTTTTEPTTTRTTTTGPTTTRSTTTEPTTTRTTTTQQTTTQTTTTEPTTTRTTTKEPTTTRSTTTTSSTTKAPPTLQFCILAFEKSACMCADRRVFIQCIILVDFSLHNNPLLTIDQSNLGNPLKYHLSRGAGTTCNDDLENSIVNLLLNLLERLEGRVIRDLPDGTGNATDAKVYCRNQVKQDVSDALSLTCPIVADYLVCISGKQGFYPGTLTNPQIYQLKLTLQLFLTNIKLDCDTDDIVGRLTTTTTQVTTPTPTTLTTSMETTSSTTKTPPTLQFCFQTFKKSACTCADRQVFSQCIIVVGISLRSNPFLIVDLSNTDTPFRELLYRGAGSTCNDNLLNTYVNFLLDLLDYLGDSVIGVLPGGTGSATDTKAYCRNQVKRDVTDALSLTCPIVADYLECFIGKLGIYPGTLTGPQIYQLEQTVRLFLNKIKLACLINDISGRLTKTTTSTTPRTTTTPYAEAQEDTTKRTDPSVPYQGCVRRSNNACKGKPNGDYPICPPDCLTGLFVTCSNYLTYFNNCASTHSGKAALVYDPVLKRCEKSSAYCRR